MCSLTAWFKVPDMVKFIGEYSGKVDDKGRIVFPSAFKSAMPPDTEMKFVIKKDIFSDCLEMYTYEEWELQSEAVKSKLNFFNRQHATFWREYMRNRAVVVPDTKLGRISVPKKLLEAIGAEKEIIFCGNDYKIEIWAKDRYESEALSEQEYAALADMLSDLK